MNKLIGIITALALGASAQGNVNLKTLINDEAWKNNTGTVNLDTMELSGDGVSGENGVITFTKGGDFEITGTFAGQLSVDTTDRIKLRLSGVNITNSTGSTIYVKNADKAYITLTEDTENILTDGESYTSGDENETACITSRDDLKIKGNGSLTVNGNYNHGIDCSDDLEISNGSITVNSKNNGIHVNDTMEIAGGDITVNSTDHALHSKTNINITGGKLTLSSETKKGITSDGDVVIDGGDIKITKSTEGIESKHTMTINGGNIDITASDDGLNAGGDGVGKNNRGGGEPPQMQDGKQPQDFGRRPENGELPQMPDGSEPPHGFGRQSDTDERDSEHHIQINGGNITINAGTDGIDSNGSLFIDGGTVTVNAQAAGAESAFDTDGAMIFNGGTIIGVSGAGLDESPNSYSKQNVIIAYTSAQIQAGTNVTVKDENGSELFNVTATQGGNKIVLSSDKLKTGGTYTISAGDEQLTAKIDGTITSAGEKQVMGFGVPRDRGAREQRQK